ncbi:MAG TPA: hypothetical protein PLX89_22825 [Verrucomicrobiota bacterium]|nr:hypothetical protein [Verrucomicrobiota bacterium]
MKRDPLKQFTALRESLSKRKAALESELAGINAALGVAASSLALRTRRAQNTMSLKEAVLAATKNKALPKAEILEAVTKLGYRFAAKDPMNSLNTLLYTDKQIKNSGGKFGPA